MNQIVFLEPNRLDSEPFTTSDVIAEYAKVNYRSIQRTIERNEGDFNVFGRVRFQITPLMTKGGVQDKKIYILNEQQATLLITYLKNTEPVRKFKVELIRQFYAMRGELLARHMYRAQGKPIRRELTDAVQEFDDSRWSYKKYTDLAYKAAIGKLAKQLREERGAAKTAVAVDYMTADELDAVNKAQYRIGMLLEMGLDYQQIKSLLLERQALMQATA